MGQSVICARVAVQLVRGQYQRAAGVPLAPSSYAREATRDLPLDYPGFLRFALHSLAIYLDLGMPSQVWLQNVLEASMDTRSGAASSLTTRKIAVRTPVLLTGGYRIRRQPLALV